MRFGYRLPSGQTRSLDLDSVDYELAAFDGRTGWLRQGERVMRFAVCKATDETVQVWLDGRTWEIEPVAATARRSAQAAAGAAGDTVTAAMPGRVLQVMVGLEEMVVAGQPLLVMESMKMEITVQAPRSGRIIALDCETGAMVTRGALLVRLEDEDASD